MEIIPRVEGLSFSAHFRDYFPRLELSSEPSLFAVRPTALVAGFSLPVHAHFSREFKTSMPTGVGPFGFNTILNRPIFLSK